MEFLRCLVLLLVLAALAVDARAQWHEYPVSSVEEGYNEDSAKLIERSRTYYHVSASGKLDSIVLYSNRSKIVYSDFISDLPTSFEHLWTIFPQPLDLQARSVELYAKDSTGTSIFKAGWYDTVSHSKTSSSEFTSDGKGGRKLSAYSWKEFDAEGYLIGSYSTRFQTRDTSTKGERFSYVRDANGNVSEVFTLKYKPGDPISRLYRDTTMMEQYIRDRSGYITEIVQTKYSWFDTSTSRTRISNIVWADTVAPFSLDIINEEPTIAYPNRIMLKGTVYRVHSPDSILNYSFEYTLDKRFRLVRGEHVNGIATREYFEDNYVKSDTYFLRNPAEMREMREERVLDAKGRVVRQEHYTNGYDLEHGKWILSRRITFTYKN